LGGLWFYYLRGCVLWLDEEWLYLKKEECLDVERRVDEMEKEWLN
jgi:hypothetical protein